LPLQGRARTVAFALFSGGTTIGIGTGVAVGGWLGADHGWRATMAIMAVPGLILALLFAATVRGPERAVHRPSGSDLPASGLLSAGPSAPPPALVVMRDIWSDPLRRSLMWAYALAAFAYAGFGQWAPTFYMRSHGMTLRDLAVTYAVSSSGGAFLGIVLGGVVVGRLIEQRMRAALGLCAVLAIAAGLFSAAAFSVADRTLSLVLFAAFGFAAGGTYAPTIALFQERSPARTRAFAAAVMMLVAILLGQGGGPFVIGILSDIVPLGAYFSPLAAALILASMSLLLSAAFLLNGLAVVRREAKTSVQPS
jgi:MFS family permease